jgi:hypothetical protein
MEFVIHHLYLMSTKTSVGIHAIRIVAIAAVIGPFASPLGATHAKICEATRTI